MEFANHGDMLLKIRENNILLSDYQVSILKRNGFNYLKYNNLSDLLFEIEEYLYDTYDEELDVVSGQIADVVYYIDQKNERL